MGPVALIHNILAPYRIGLFNEINKALNGELVLLLGRETHPRRRSWQVPRHELEVRAELLRTFSFDWAAGAIDVSFGVKRLLSELDASSVIVTGYDLFGNWRAAAWAREHGRPLLAWTEGWTGSVRHQSAPFNFVRTRYFRSPDAFIVPGRLAEQYVRNFATGPFFHAPNSIAVPELRSLPRPANVGRAVFVGDASLHKGFDILMESVPDLLDIFDGVDVLGEGPLLNSAREAFRDETRIEFHGYAHPPERAAVISMASTLILPSRRDSWPLAAAEGLVAQRSLVLGPGVGSAPDLKQLGGPAVALMRSSDPAELVRAARLAAVEKPPNSVRLELTHESSASVFLDALWHVRRTRR